MSKESRPFVTVFEGVDSIFPDSTRRGDAEAGDNNQVQVALVFYLSNRENNRRELLLLVWVFVSK